MLDFRGRAQCVWGQQSRNSYAQRSAAQCSLLSDPTLDAFLGLLVPFLSERCVERGGPRFPGSRAGCFAPSLSDRKRGHRRWRSRNTVDSGRDRQSLERWDGGEGHKLGR